MDLKKSLIAILLVATLVISLIGSIVPAQATGNNPDGIEQFVSRMYTYVLNRNVDRNYSGLRFWTDRLRNGTESGASVAHGFFFSNEFVRANHSNDVFINRLYRAILGRGADETGFAYWTNHMNRGMSREAVLLGFINSREFGNLARQHGIERGTLTVAHASASASAPASEPTPGNTAIRDFVLRLYREALGRRVDPGPSETNYWTNGLSSGRYTGATAAFAFFFGNEMAGRRLTNEAFVDALYRGMLGRAPNANERASHVNQLNSGIPRENVFAGFVASSEFARVCEQAGITRGTFTPPPIDMVRVFVVRLYREALGRTVEPSRAEITYWTNGLSRGRYTGATAAFAFFFSDEMAGRRLTNAAFVEALYRGMLGRASNANEGATWVNQLNRGTSRHAVFVGFANSVEFERVCRAHGITRGTPPPAPPPQTVRGLDTSVTGPHAVRTAAQRDHDRMIWNALVATGLSEHKAAAMLGNLFAESTNRSDLAERAHHDRIRPALIAAFPDDVRVPGTDAAYIMAINRGWYSRREFQDDRVGFGLSQWTWWARKRDLHNFVRDNACLQTFPCCIAPDSDCRPENGTDGFNIACMCRQVRFLVHEMRTYNNGVFWRNFNNAQSVREASDIVLTQFKKPANQPAASIRRAGYSQGYFEWFRAR